MYDPICAIDDGMTDLMNGKANLAELLKAGKHPHGRVRKRARISRQGERCEARAGYHSSTEELQHELDDLFEEYVKW
ncbi:hypothetical protein M758_UG198200 [Ceratodon purpureus]|nr:hypothetical protein M758_UG198200 [Ceratodon purpureus]